MLNDVLNSDIYSIKYVLKKALNTVSLTRAFPPMHTHMSPSDSIPTLAAFMWCQHMKGSTSGYGSCCTVDSDRVTKLLTRSDNNPAVTDSLSL